MAKIQVLEARLNAQRTNLSASSGAVDAQYEAMAVQVEQLEEEKVDVFDLKMEIKLIKGKIMTGNFYFITMLVKNFHKLIFVD